MICRWRRGRGRYNTFVGCALFARGDEAFQKGVILGRWCRSRVSFICSSHVHLPLGHLVGIVVVTG